MFKEKVNALTDARRTQDHDISPAGLWSVELINVASSVHKAKCCRRTTDDGQKAIPKAHHEHHVLR
ncbi:hypothetical protein DPMN_115471 [Dreissena polymorpha]|uniref:Uncharacterized protein n=1 Tax=Dreissena polymorpha TaxID=45954 RepID=A0A9D4KM41_DREPO|nr:hypothetical protein DPMN_115471 [Dreissena polymorpha]